MSVDLTNLVPNLVAEITTPGVTTYATVSDDDWLLRLQNGFWEARLDGLIAAWTESEGIVTPIQSSGTDMPRDLQQLVILYTAFSVLRNTLQTMRTQFRASAGAVSFEYQQSSNAITQMLKDISERRAILLTRLSDLGMVPSYVMDSFALRNASMVSNDTWFVGA